MLPCIHIYMLTYILPYYPFHIFISTPSHAHISPFILKTPDDILTYFQPFILTRLYSNFPSYLRSSFTFSNSCIFSVLRTYMLTAHILSCCHNTYSYIYRFIYIYTNKITYIHSSVPTFYNFYILLFVNFKLIPSVLSCIFSLPTYFLTYSHTWLHFFLIN